MASVETRSLTAELEWVHPTDIVEAACQHAEAASFREIDIRDESGDHVVHLDPPHHFCSAGTCARECGDASTSSSPVSIHINVTGDRLALAVRDRGPGLPPTNWTASSTGSIEGPEQRRTSSVAVWAWRSRATPGYPGRRIRADNHPDGAAIFTLSTAASRVVAVAEADA